MSYNAPKDIANTFLQIGNNKTELKLSKLSLLAILGGAFIAFGGLLSVVVAGGMPGIGAGNPGLVKFIAGALFPVGLIMVSVAGADLFTSNCAILTFPLLEKTKTIGILLKVMLISYVLNFVGTQIVAYFLSTSVHLLDSDPWREYLHNLADSKVSKDFHTVFIKGIGANWLVCLGTWMGLAAKDVIGKCIGIWLPVMLFVALGYEHSIANMFFIPAAIYSGASITWFDFIFQNLIPSTLGNIVGGALLVGCIYWYIYTKKE